MEFSVIRSSEGLVAPSEETPIEVLDLSVIDKLHVLRCNARTLHVFKNGPDAAHIIRQALSKALVPYYPLAGRLKDDESSQGQLQISCSGEGVWFVEATASCELVDVAYFDDVMCIPYDKLLPDSPPEELKSDPLILMQVTQFKCGGYVMGLIFCHSICDGLGAAQFLNAVGEMARGLQHLSVLPIWSRDFAPPPTSQSTQVTIPMPNLPPPMPNYQLKHANIDITLDHINQLKQKYNEPTGQTCSAFELVAATTWMHRTVAINLQEDTEMKLVFFANCRDLLTPQLPKGFYGNCFFPVTITASSEMLKKESVFNVVKLIQQAKSQLPNEFGKWIKGELKDENGPVDPFAPPLVYTTLFISEWGKLGFNQVDYGHGLPVNVVPIQGSSIIPVGIIGFIPGPKKGIRLMTWCVKKAHLEPFIQHMTSPI
ncbi:10-deacetylbaccatin III 10-O-acetyltransferase [Heracleum sosnowskyi]|uniref:10-deacetylbaccatin III 10-O-acetyltransferase n=1 Tax=Heracleum sosnowskyi TaxID=360622 RepID=A0AAD8GZH1_9APIA|nr:10-deacetylbaccatin III 10-O-acetyltransferase [Heracleum sosnowskyi]